MDFTLSSNHNPHQSCAIRMTLTYLFFVCFAASCCIVGVHSFSPVPVPVLVHPASSTCPPQHAQPAATISIAAYASQRRSRQSSSTLFLVGRHNPRWNLSPTSLSVASATSSSSSSSSDSNSIEYPPASDGEAIQSLFAKHCSSDGLMSEDQLRNVPAIKDMLEQGDILSSELIQIWKSAPKFPQEVIMEDGSNDKIDVDSFIQVYRDIDDLFEDDSSTGEGGEDLAIAATSELEDGDGVVEPAQTFATLAKMGSDDNTISFSQLRQWDEITSLIEEGLLGEDEFVTLWKTSLNVKGEDGSMNLQGFGKFNDALDQLFEMDDELLEEYEDDDSDDAEEEAVDVDDDDAPAQPVAVVPLPIITEDDLPPGVLFSQLANENYLVGKLELQRWGELNDMLKGGDLTVDELDSIFDDVVKAPGTKDMLDEDGFYALYDAIDSLFEDDTEDEVVQKKSEDSRELKEELLDFIDDIAKLSEAEGRQLCGLDCSELEQERVLEIVSEMEREPYNQVVASSASGSDAITKDQLVGLWTLIYSSSSTMKYNEGLSGLAGGLTKFGGLQQLLSATKYLADVEYTEQVVGKLGGKSFEVKIKGDWDLRTEISLFTGKPSNVLSVTPDRVIYGPRSDKADHWKSLGPMNMLVLSYLDEGLRVMRGNTSTDTLFIWRRSN